MSALDLEKLEEGFGVADAPFRVRADEDAQDGPAYDIISTKDGLIYLARCWNPDTAAALLQAPALLEEVRRLRERERVLEGEVLALGSALRQVRDGCRCGIAPCECGSDFAEIADAALGEVKP